MERLTHFQRDLLTVVSGLDEPNGLEIRDELEDVYGPVNHGRLYPNLDHLVNVGLVDKGARNDRANYYTLTDDGGAWLRRKQEWEAQYIEEP